MSMTAVDGRGIALITGGARRIGRTIAIALAGRGWDVAVHYRRSEKDARRTVEDIVALGRRAVALRADLAQESEMLALLPAAAEAIGLPTLLVNNASLFSFDDAASVNYASIDAHMSVNCVAPVELAHELYRRLPDNTRGAVVNILDQKLWNWNPDFFAYSLSKAALHAATIMLSQALAPKLRVAAVAPGVTLDWPGANAEKFAAAHRCTPLGRSSHPEDIAQAVCYLAEAHAVTGTTLIVDGGQHLWPSRRDIQFEV